MNAVEIEQAITDLAEQPFDAANFAYAFLEAFGNKATTIQRLRSGATNKSDLGGVLALWGTGEYLSVPASVVAPARWSMNSASG